MLIVGLIALNTAIFAAQPVVTTSDFTSEVSAGYVSKYVEFGDVTATGVYTAGAEVNWQSFKVAVNTLNTVEISPFTAALNRVDLTGAYKFTSTLADVSVGTTYIHFNNANKLDFSGHWRPFVSVTNKYLGVTAAYDTQSRLANFEAKTKYSVDLTNGITVTPALFVGYTNVADALPKTVKAISYTNGYAGADLTLAYGVLSVGGFVLQDGHTGRVDGGWHTAVKYNF